MAANAHKKATTRAMPGLKCGVLSQTSCRCGGSRSPDGNQTCNVWARLIPKPRAPLKRRKIHHSFCKAGWVSLGSLRLWRLASCADGAKLLPTRDPLMRQMALKNGAAELCKPPTIVVGVRPTIGAKPGRAAELCKSPSTAVASRVTPHSAQ